MSTQTELDALKAQAIDLLSGADALSTQAANLYSAVTAQEDATELLGISLAAFTLPEPPPPPPPPPAADLLTWAPPVLSPPGVLTIPRAGGTFNLPAGRDYLITSPEPIVGTVNLRGGRNIIWLGAEWDIDTPGRGDDACITVGGSISQSPTGTIHFEGFKFGGDWLNEAFDLRCPNAVVQIQNALVNKLEGGSGQGHGDMIQPTNGFRELRVDGFTGLSEYQGFFLRVANGFVGEAIFLRRCNLKATQPIGSKLYSFWTYDRTTLPGVDNTGPIHLDECYVEGTNQAARELVVSVLRDGALANLTVDGSKLWWPNSPPGSPKIRTFDGTGAGFITAGQPAGGDFVKTAGIGYVSPGYR